MKKLEGIHHVTAITGDAQRNADFYSGLLGLRLVKKTVNFDDPGSYHLYYGDSAGTPGTLVTFFAWPGAGAGKLGAGEPAALAFEIPEGSSAWWTEQIKRAASYIGTAKRFGSEIILARDPDGMNVELVESSQPRNTEYWSASPVRREHGIKTIHGITLNYRDASASTRYFPAQVTFEAGPKEQSRSRFIVGEGNAAGFVDTVQDPTLSRSRMGAGTIHHVAFRTDTDESQREWLDGLSRLGVHSSPVMDRKYFHSIYFREPGGVLFEIATDGPGMAVDENAAHLGESLALPAMYESHRAQLEQTLVPITVPAAGAAR